MNEGSARRLDEYSGRLSRHVNTTTEWITYLVGRLPAEEHAALTKAILAGEFPRNYDEGRKAKEAKDGR